MSKYSKDFKLEVIHHYLSGKEGFTATAKRYGVKFTYVRTWFMLLKLMVKKV